MKNISSKQIILNIFTYDDYRLFMRDYFAAKKNENPGFSQRYFAARAGFHAHNFCTLVVTGKRNLAAGSIQKIIKAAGLRGRAASFFENLVYLNQSTALDDKEHYFQRIKRIGKTADFYQVNKEQFFFYETWYYPVVRELMVLADWKNDYAALAGMVRPGISQYEAEEAAKRLVATGMVTKHENGAYTLNNEFVTSENVPALIKKKARRDVLLKGIETIDSMAPAEKYAAYATLTMSKNLYSEVRELLDEMRRKIHTLVAADKPADEVYEVVFQMFPVSQMHGNRNNPCPENDHAA